MAKGFKTGGRTRGTPNKTTAALKDAILAALAQVGGQSYLERVAEEDPKTFCALLGRVLPMTLSGDATNPLVIKVVR